MFKRENRDEVVRLRVTTEEKEILKKFAQEKDLTMSAVIAQALDNYLDATTPKDFEQMEVYYNGKKDKALTRKAQNALAFSKRYDEIMGNKTSLTLFWEIEKIGCWRWRIEKVEKIAVKESKNWAVKKLALANF